MAGPAQIKVDVRLERVRENVRSIRQRVGVDVLAVVKADAYGLGAARVAEAIADDVAGFCVFSLDEAVEADLWRRTGKPILAIGPVQSFDVEAYQRQHVRPAVATVEQAQRLAACGPVLCVDTGMQRFACPAEEVEAVLRTGAIDEAFTHATRLEHALKLRDLLGGRGIRLHAAASSLLNEPEAHLDAVRPGLACYRGALRVSTPLLEVHRSRGPVGYGGFLSATGRHGVIIGGYSNGLSPGVCLVNGQRRRIAEVGMQSAYVEIGENDRAGDEVVLLGDDLSAAEVATAWGCSEHEALLRMARCSRSRAGV